MLYLYLYIIQLVCSFVLELDKTTAQDVTKLTGLMKYESGSVLHGLKLPVLLFLGRYPSFCGFLD